jgi:hypothetical protein
VWLCDAAAADDNDDDPMLLLLIDDDYLGRLSNALATHLKKKILLINFPYRKSIYIYMYIHIRVPPVSLYVYPAPPPNPYKRYHDLS